MDSVFGFVVILLEVLALFNLLIIVHELGHFWAARWRGLYVERFGVWFGKPLWERSYGGVRYSLGCIPFGGFVALPQMAPMEALEGESRVKFGDLPRVGVWDRVVVAFAGPLFSFGLALVFGLVVWQVGRPVSEREMTTTVGYVVGGSPAEEAGLLPGDRFLEIDGGGVSSWTGIGDAVTWRIVSSVNERISMRVERDGVVRELWVRPVVPDTRVWERAALKRIEVLPMQTPVVADVLEGSPAAVAGLRANDVIESVNGVRLWSPMMLSDYVVEHGGEVLVLGVVRDGEGLEVSLRAVEPLRLPGDLRGGLVRLGMGLAGMVPVCFDGLEGGGMIGVVWDLSGRLVLAHPGPWQQVKDSVMKMVDTLGAIFSRNDGIGAQHLSGPIGIMRIYYLLFESPYGWKLALWFSVLLNVNLAILNLLPIPVLDGGHIVMALVEWVFRRPIPFGVLSYVQNGCALLVIGYMLYITFYDVQDLPWKRDGGVGEAVYFVGSGGGGSVVE